MFSTLLAQVAAWFLLLPALGGAQGAPAKSTASPHGNLAIACQNCHTVSGWKPIRTVPEFDHNKTRYPLRGMHEGVACTQCHTKMIFSNVGSKCADCHADIHRGQFGANCEQCHSVKGWTVDVKSIQNHNNRFPLIGAHAMAQCDDCHKGAASGQFQGLSTECGTCHLKEYQGTTNPSHSVNQKWFPIAGCQQCHNTNSWAGAIFDHSVTGFPLTGAHATLDCTACHVGGVFTPQSTQCVSCHLKDYNATTNPNHAAGGFPQTCQECHTTTTWLGAVFNHGGPPANWPLTGAHATALCSQCHVNNNYNLTSTACSSCHQSNYDAAKNPVHSATVFPETQCATCHTTTAWQPASFANHALTGFVLDGAHASLPCAQCHDATRGYTISTNTCVSCHQSNYDTTTNPNHVAQSFPTTCNTCHNTTAWQPASFNHSTTGFPLTGKHSTLQCTQCHISNNYNLTSNACVTCHLPDYQSTTNPNHVSANFPQTCQNCHSTTDWTGATFDHSQPPASWALVGLHMVPPRACSDCHTATVGYNISSTACIGCHQNDYDTTTNPAHKSGNFPTDCTVCHGTSASSWLGATFNHSVAPANWPLTGAHMVPPRACTDCHTAQLGYTLSSTLCITCHATDYNTATSPVDHVGAKFPTTCETCHDTVLWTDGKFDHTTTGFALSGAHLVPPRACVDCHDATRGYNITTMTCVSCHQTDYNNAKTPVDHPGANFPLTCDTCHDTIVWTDGKFNHSSTGFTLDGFHATMQCTQCHNATYGNYNITSNSCILCHLTDFNGTNNPPHAGFPSTAQSCVTTCHHTTTDWTGATFDHSQAPANWALQGAHATVACNLCHVNNNYSLTAATAANCDSCHDADFRGATSPNHVALGWPTTCTTCHIWPSQNWLNVTLPALYHTWFSPSHQGSTCGTDCHQNAPTDYSTYQCYVACHHHTKANTDGDHQGRAGYSYGTNGDTCAASGCHGK
jgi:hypothetical protein